MKKIYIMICSCLLVLSGCKKNFDPQFYSTLNPSIFPSNAAEYELYALEMYKPFYSRWGYGGAIEWENNFFSPEWGHLVMFDGSTDLMPEFKNWGGFWQGFTSADFTFMKSQGRGSHFEKVRMVSRATKILDDLEKAPSSVLPDAKKQQLMAEVRMSRGWIMYYLLHIYGPVPVILDPAKIGTSAEADVTKPSRADFVKGIEADLRFAANNLVKAPAEYGRFNKGLALTVLMRLYLNEKDFAKAESTGREILPLGYDLVGDYASLFKEATEKNIETIWAVSCANPAAAGNFNAWPFYCYPSDYIGNKIPTGWGGTTGVLSASWNFYDSFLPTDKRRQLLIAEYVASDAAKTLKNRTNMNGAVIAKYADEGGLLNSVQGNDVVVCRYADVLLMLAEAINENNPAPTSEAIGYVEKVRLRSNAGVLSPLEKASKTAFRDMLFVERAHELYFEGLRKMDLIRMGKVTTALAAAGKTAGPNYNVFPLPEYAVTNSNNKLPQNDGYK